MRSVLAIALVVVSGGCFPNDTPAACGSDRDCGGEVCTRDEQCTPASEVRSVRITWTIAGMPASATACASSPYLFVQVDGETATDEIAFAPVPCDQGLFNFDKLPTRYGIAELGLDGSGSGMQVAIDSSNAAQFDLFAQ